MIESSLASLGAKVVVASSSDENHPPENITDGNTNTFWMSTGMFPQEFIIRFAEPTDISAVTVDSYNVKHLKIEKNTSQNASQFESVTEKNFNKQRDIFSQMLFRLMGAVQLTFVSSSPQDMIICLSASSQCATLTLLIVVY
ncbi:Intraflagellar transport protein 25 like [Dissostichus eleginoides]|uniref:Intraflagellar transport protein 25 like n=1 Tax=Dissostichus eleginoides TaxID=100907 RepID=A0AAD9C1H7_DISEL|nr:Intraflagellar transport protein 25 like [Dissostichus eleginoides]